MEKLVQHNLLYYVHSTILLELEPKLYSHIHKQHTLWHPHYTGVGDLL